jgi:hypothetical protein
MVRSLALIVAGSFLGIGCMAAPARAEDQVTIREDFEHGMDRWETTDVDQRFWEIVEVARGDQKTHALRCTGASTYLPPVRSPHSIALVKELVLGDFEITATVQNTNADAGNHRDLCFFWGHQDPSHFYYVHLGAKADPHSCQIFIVNGEPRTKISVKESAGIPWTEGWHQVKVVRKVGDGSIEVFFDDLQTPVMTARDKTFLWGRVGIGTFDDHGNFDDLLITGTRVDRPASKIRVTE